jgi:hypothetical protein
MHTKRKRPSPHPKNLPINSATTTSRMKSPINKDRKKINKYKSPRKSFQFSNFHQVLDEITAQLPTAPLDSTVNAAAPLDSNANEHTPLDSTVNNNTPSDDQQEEVAQDQPAAAAPVENMWRDVEVNCPPDTSCDPDNENYDFEGEEYRYTITGDGKKDEDWIASQEDTSEDDQYLPQQSEQKDINVVPKSDPTMDGMPKEKGQSVNKK